MTAHMKWTLARLAIFSESRHKPLTKLLRACYNSEAFSQNSEGALFLPCDENGMATSFEVAILVSAKSPSEASGEVLGG